MNILFSGGGTLGSVTPLLAIKEIIDRHESGVQFFWVGTKNGPEKQFVEEYGIPFTTLTSGKFRRYISIWNVIDIARVAIGFFQSIGILLKAKPDVCISAGGFISVPLHWAAWVLRIPTWIHQQDVHVGLANALMAPCATRITTALEESLSDFPKRKTEWLGNPVRGDILSGTKKQGIERFGLKPELPVVFVTGGGTGSARVNELVAEAVQHLEGVCQIIHLSGQERPQEMVERTDALFEHYQVHQFFTDEMKDAYATADLIISRGGFGTITEIAALGKPAILIPKPGHQDENVTFLTKHGAVISVSEITSDGLYLAKMIKKIIQDSKQREELGERIKKILPVADSNAIISLIQSCVK